MPAATTSISRIADRARAVLLALALIAGGAGTAQAMSFALETGEQGRKVVVARGVIEGGDARRLRDALQGADRDDWGNRQLVLESLGGNVGEAFLMVEVMEAEKVTTRVRAGKSCASACAYCRRARARFVSCVLPPSGYDAVTEKVHVGNLLVSRSPSTEV